MTLLLDSWKKYRWFRFLITGGINTGFSYGIYALLVFVGVNVYVSNLCSLVLGILFSFRTQATFVFRNSERGLFLRYVGVWTLLYFSNSLMIGSMIGLGASAYVAGALAIAPTAVLSYFLQKYLVFPEMKRG